MFKFTATRTAAITRDMTDRSWTAEAIDTDTDTVVCDYTTVPVTWSDVTGERWALVRGTDLADADAIVGAAYRDLEAALAAAEDDARGLHQGARDAAADRVMPEPDMLAAMPGEFASAYREAFEAWHADDAAAEAERRAGA